MGQKRRTKRWRKKIFSIHLWEELVKNANYTKVSSRINVGIVTEKEK